ncbi:MAG: ChaN family lipoprotein [Desulfobacterales bacterium]|jgi:uncharacterized iron-regulated protein
MVKTAFSTAIFLVGVLIGPLTAGTIATPQFYSLKDKSLVSPAAMAETLAAHRIVLVGESHTAVSHHQGQLSVIQLLNEKKVPVAIGMEMMRRDSQPYLDAWIDGALSEDEFQAIYLDNWNYPWSLYRPIFVYAREHKIPIVGLNVSRGITRQVAREGFDSLSDTQREGLPFVTCSVDDDYMKFIRQAYGAHAHGQMQFDHFCEAQLVWDKAMAANALRYVEQAPERVMVILAGSGHARQGGIPTQLDTLGQISYQVILPEIPSVLDTQTIDSGDADFLLQGL